MTYEEIRELKPGTLIHWVSESDDSTAVVLGRADDFIDHLAIRGSQLLIYLHRSYAGAHGWSDKCGVRHKNWRVVGPDNPELVSEVICAGPEEGDCADMETVYAES